MSDLSANQRRLVWASLGIVITGILLAYVRQEIVSPPGPAGESDRTPSAKLPVYGAVPQFSLTNQSGATVTLESYRGKVWLADIIFTRCPGPCARMTERLRDLQAALRVDANVKLVSISTDPGFDTPAVLAKYGKAHGYDPSRWHFLTGTKADIINLTVDGLKLTSVDKQERDREAPNDLFIHSTNLVIVDKLGRLRASFQLLGMDPGDNGAAVPPLPWESMKADIINAVNQLLKE